MTSTPSLTIRPLRSIDETDWRRLWTGYLAFYKTSVPEAVYASTFARLLGDDPQDFHGLVAEQDGVLVGLVHYVFHRHCWRIENVCYLQDLYADPTVRGTGVGRELIEAVYAAAQNGNNYRISTAYFISLFKNSVRQITCCRRLCPSEIQGAIFREIVEAKFRKHFEASFPYHFSII